MGPSVKRRCRGRGPPCWSRQGYPRAGQVQRDGPPLRRGECRLPLHLPPHGPHQGQPLLPHEEAGGGGLHRGEEGLRWKEAPHGSRHHGEGAGGLQGLRVRHEEHTGEAGDVNLGA